MRVQPAGLPSQPACSGKPRTESAVRSGIVIGRRHDRIGGIWYPIGSFQTDRCGASRSYSSEVIPTTNRSFPGWRGSSMSLK